MPMSYARASAQLSAASTTADPRLVTMAADETNPNFGKVEYFECMA